MRLLILLPIFLGLLVSFQGCKSSGGFYVVNMQVKDKGISTENNPKGMEAGTLYASGGDGFIRFKDRAMWEEIEKGKFYVMQFNDEGWVFSLNSSTVQKDYIIVD